MIKKDLSHSKFEVEIYSSSRETDVDAWISKYDLYARMNKWAQEDKIDFMEAFLGPKEASWF
ncbi:hypothetical protein BB560_004290, partial [Smittium megazygosporum]